MVFEDFLLFFGMMQPHRWEHDPPVIVHKVSRTAMSSRSWDLDGFCTPPGAGSEFCYPRVMLCFSSLCSFKMLLFPQTRGILTYHYLWVYDKSMNIYILLQYVHACICLNIYAYLYICRYHIYIFPWFQRFDLGPEKGLLISPGCFSGTWEISKTTFPLPLKSLWLGDER